MAESTKSKTTKKAQKPATASPKPTKTKKSTVAPKRRGKRPSSQVPVKQYLRMRGLSAALTEVLIAQVGSRKATLVQWDQAWADILSSPA